MGAVVDTPLQIKKPGDKDYCDSCDRQGLAILVGLYGVIPTQNYGTAARNGYDWVRYMEADSTPFFGDFDQNHYLSARKLADANSGNMLQCSHYVLRRLRMGYLYIYYPNDKTWDLYRVQSDGRMLLMQYDMIHAVGKGDMACSRFQSNTDALLLVVDPHKHPDFWIGFSDAMWTADVRKDVAANPSLYMKHVTIADKENLVGFEGSEFIKSTVLGFQDRPLHDTLDKEAYLRGTKVPASNVYDSLVAHNKPFNATGLILPLEDDVGITTQLNFSRNLALIDIMGEGAGYTELDRNKMDTAGLLEGVKDIVGDQWPRMEKHLRSGDYASYLEKFHRCAEAQANFNSYSHDYLIWMQYLLSKKIYKLFDPNVPAIGLSLARIVADLFEGCGLTKDEFDKILKPQLSADVTDPNQLLWRGAAANDKGLLDKLTDATIDKTLVEGKKKFDEGKEQLSLLQEVREAKIKAAARNQAEWSRLARLIAARGKRLHDADAKAFRRTFRRIQLSTLTIENVAVLELAVQGDAAAYLQQLRNTMNGSSNLKVTPKNTTQMVALSDLLVAVWQPGEPMPAGLADAMKTLGIAPNELPRSVVIKAGEEAPSTKGLRGLMGMNAGMAALQIFAFIKSVNELGADITKAKATSDPEWSRITKETFEAGAGLTGAASAGFEVAAVGQQLVAAGEKTPLFWRLSLTAGRVGLWASAFEAGSGIMDVVELWKQNDDAASGSKLGNVVASAFSSGFAYAALRMTARAALEEAAKKAALGTAGELAVEAATASAAARGGAVVASEAPPLAMILTIASIGAWVASLGFDAYSKFLTTTPFEKWADRCFLGQRSAKWGAPYHGVKDQLDDLLRLFYTVKIDMPSVFGGDEALEVSVPAFGEASELDIVVDSAGTTVAHYLLRYDNHGGSSPVKLENLARPQIGVAVHTEATREGEGLKVRILVGGHDENWVDRAKEMGMQILMPWMKGVEIAHNIVRGTPRVVVRYYPNEAAYPNFYAGAGEADLKVKEQTRKSE